ncbi:hypothetical protein NPIL_578281 [Nephila pilipes]|uniref:Uncharacterized protein n=1 Tax=Nephila pilipes TaxID=299642 RepID=A0A8X6TVA3_NEPPI|nr:hypothetical protein NPIL_578281 [Nephila pilipes]
MYSGLVHSDTSTTLTYLILLTSELFHSSSASSPPPKNSEADHLSFLLPFGKGVEAEKFHPPLITARRQMIVPDTLSNDPHCSI